MGRTDESSPDARFDEVTMSRLRSFVAVAEAGGYAPAAPGDPSRQSQLNRQVRELERALGADLVRREGRGLVVTAAGQRLRAVATDLFEGLGEVSASVGDRTVDLALAAGDSLLHWLVLPRAGEAVGHLRGVRLTVFASSSPVDEVLSGRAHFALGRARELGPELTHRNVGAVAYALFVPKKLARGATEIEQLIASVPLVRVTGDPGAFDEIVGDRVAPALACETFPQAARAVASGRYAAILPAIAEVELGAVATAMPVKVRGGGVQIALVARARVFEARSVVAEAYRAIAGALRAAMATRPA
jgi:DNA-binding transcriptional LysR family regulator